MASEGGKLLVLDETLNVKNEYNTINDRPLSLSATKEYIAVGFDGGDVIKCLFYQRNVSSEPTVRVKPRK